MNRSSGKPTQAEPPLSCEDDGLAKKMQQKRLFDRETIATIDRNFWQETRAALALLVWQLR